jgi:hypothetical protein
VAFDELSATGNPREEGLLTLAEMAAFDVCVLSKQGPMSEGDKAALEEQNNKHSAALAKALAEKDAEIQKWKDALKAANGSAGEAGIPKGPPAGPPAAPPNVTTPDANGLLVLALQKITEQLSKTHVPSVTTTESSYTKFTNLMDKHVKDGSYFLFTNLHHLHVEKVKRSGAAPDRVSLGQGLSLQHTHLDPDGTCKDSKAMNDGFIHYLAKCAACPEVSKEMLADMLLFHYRLFSFRENLVTAEQRTTYLDKFFQDFHDRRGEWCALFKSETDLMLAHLSPMAPVMHPNGNGGGKRDREKQGKESPKKRQLQHDRPKNFCFSASRKGAHACLPVKNAACLFDHTCPMHPGVEHQGGAAACPDFDAAKFNAALKSRAGPKRG